MARIVPVIDVLGGRVMRAVGGRRSEYRPLVSRLTTSTEPVEVARALLAATGASELYVADLDAISAPDPILTPNSTVLSELVGLGATVWVDYGHRRDFDEATVMAAGVRWLVLGTETLSNSHTLFHTKLMMDDCGGVMLSVDLHGGQLRWDRRGWDFGDDASPLELVRDAVFCWDVSRVLLLDLEPVGGRSGPSTVELCRAVYDEHPEIDLWTGGGVRGWDDVKHLADAGADAVLVASALHDGTLP